MKTIWLILLTLIIIPVLFAIGFGARYLWILSYKFFAPMEQNVRREVFENTQSYVEWKRQELTKYRLEYLTTKDEDVKAAIRMTIVQSFANFDQSKLSYELRTFLNNLN